MARLRRWNSGIPEFGRSAERTGCSFTNIFPFRRPGARVLTTRAGRFAHGARNVQDIAILLECGAGLSIQTLGKRSEERRVGKECRLRWATKHEKKKKLKRSANRQ